MVSIFVTSQGQEPYVTTQCKKSTRFILTQVPTPALFLLSVVDTMMVRIRANTETVCISRRT